LSFFFVHFTSSAPYPPLQILILAVATHTQKLTITQQKKDVALPPIFYLFLVMGTQTSFHERLDFFIKLSPLFAHNFESRADNDYTKAAPGHQYNAQCHRQLVDGA